LLAPPAVAVVAAPPMQATRVSAEWTTGRYQGGSMAIAARPRLADLVKSDTVHRDVYTSEEIFRLEMRHIFGSTWVFVAHETEVPKVGDFKTDTIAGQPIIVIRDDADHVNVLFNACRHRGATLSLNPTGNTRSLRCPYHGWTYRNNGQLSGVPYREGFCPDFDPADYPLLRPPRVDSYRGFIFASLNPDVPELTEHLGRATHYIDEMIARAPAGRITAVKPIQYKYPGNWKLQLENYVDVYHPVFVHESLFTTKGRRQAPSEATRFKSKQIERALGRGHAVVDFCGGRPSFPECNEDPGYLAALARSYGPERGAELAATDINIVVYPNLLLQTQLTHYRVVKPVSIDLTEVHTYPCRLEGAPEEVNERVLKNTVLFVSPGGELQVDDLEAFAHCQAGLKVEALEWVLFKLNSQQEYVNELGERVNHGISEMLQREYYREWLRLMAAAV
jgi:benzoate/toluate 1,2-dioxygenase alpha subunit